MYHFLRSCHPTCCQCSQRAAQLTLRACCPLSCFPSGVDVIEAGFPIASPDDFAGVRAIAQEVRMGFTVAGDRRKPSWLGGTSLYY